MILKNMVSGCHGNRSTVGLDDLKRSFLALMILRLNKHLYELLFFHCNVFLKKKKKVKTIPPTLLTDVNLKNCKVLT